ncbi:MAG TPA: polysaccharide biosynthesis protein [Myxococcaceae bacterium]|jgi:UDP-N-acetylglucosamine 4,6-dehydratase
MNWSRTSVLITGASGSFGRRFITALLRDQRPKRVVAFSRDEHKQHDMRQAGLKSPRLSYVIGDVRDPRSLREALHGIDVVVHAAALKHVPVCEAQPLEAIQTNLLGAQNVIDAATAAGVSHVVGLSTDKAVHPANAYGAAKLLAERLFLAADARPVRGTRFACVRYGNVLGSRGSILESLWAQRQKGRVTITDPRMTRFWMTLDEAVDVVLASLERMRGGEIFIPKVRSARTVDLVKAAAPGCVVEIVGLRPGEKVHELLISDDEAPYVIERGGLYVLTPGIRAKRGKRFQGERYSSRDAEHFTAEELRVLVEPPPALAEPQPAPRGAHLAAR